MLCIFLWTNTSNSEISKYPQAEIIGTDLSLIQPKWQEPPTETSHKEVSNMERHRIPKNLRFQISDFESEWALGRDSFDLIHLRHAIGSVSSYPALFRKIFE